MDFTKTGLNKDIMDIRAKIAKAHEDEKILMIENGRLDKQIKMMLHEKNKIAKKCSKLVLHRNRLVNLLKNDVHYKPI